MAKSQTSAPVGQLGIHICHSIIAKLPTPVFSIISVQGKEAKYYVKCNPFITSEEMNKLYTAEDLL